MKQCDEIRKDASLYLDNELAPERIRSFDEHLSSCKDCREFMENEACVEQMLGDVIAMPEKGDDAIWVKAVSALETSKKHPNRRILRYLVPASAAALLVLAIGVFMLFPVAQVPLLMADVVQAHETALKAEFQPELRTDSTGALATYFNGKCGMDPELCGCMMQNTPLTIKGGNICDLKERPAAQILADYNGTPVSLLILQAKDMPAEFAARDACHTMCSGKIGKYNCVMVRLNDHFVWAVSSVEPDILKKVLSESEGMMKDCSTCPDCQKGQMK